MKIEKTYAVGGKEIIFMALVLIGIITAIGYFGELGDPQHAFDYLNVKLADATIGHALAFLFCSYLWFGK